MCARTARTKKRIYARIPKIVLRYIDLPCTFCMCDYVCDWMWMSTTCAFFKTSYCYYCIVTREENKPLYRGTKQNCCKYLRLLPSRNLIGSTCIIHTYSCLVIFWYIWKEEKDKYVFSWRRIGRFVFNHCKNTPYILIERGPNHLLVPF